MSRSDDQGCIRGCTDGHFAACPSYGNAEGECKGCAPASRVYGTLLCDRCYRRLRFLLHSASDILGRMRTLALQGKAVVYSAARGSTGSASAPDQVDAALLEATHIVTAKLERWGGWIRNGRATLDEALCREDLAPEIVADLLDQHPAGVTDWPIGEWTLADAHARWGTERRDTYVYPAEDESEGVVIVSPVHEWFDPILQMSAAAKRAGISERQLRNWMKEGIIEPAARHREAGVLRTSSGRPSGGRMVLWFQASKIDAAAEMMRTRAAATRFGAKEDMPRGA